jgi:hypothetical protein
MDCCVLSAQEVGQMAHYNMLPNHRNHHHISVDEATKGVLEDLYELITGKNGRHYVTPAKLHYLRPVISGGIAVIQRVISNQPKYIEPVRF